MVNLLLLSCFHTFWAKYDSVAMFIPSSVDKIVFLTFIPKILQSWLSFIFICIHHVSEISGCHSTVNVTPFWKINKLKQKNNKSILVNGNNKSSFTIFPKCIILHISWKWVKIFSNEFLLKLIDCHSYGQINAIAYASYILLRKFPVL